jgi:hypothetical protein
VRVWGGVGGVCVCMCARACEFEWVCGWEGRGVFVCMYVRARACVCMCVRAGARVCKH